MSAANLDLFLQKLQNEMDTKDSEGKKRDPAQEHRVGEVDYKATTLTYREFDIFHAIDKIGSDGLGKEFDQDYTKLVTNLSANIRLAFDTYALSDKSSIVSVSGNNEEVTITLLKTKEGRNNYKTAKALYDAEMTQFYTEFLKLVGKPGGLERWSGSAKDPITGKKGAMISIKSQGKLVVAAHGVSNIQHLVNDAVWNAMDKTNKESPNAPKSVKEELEALAKSTGRGDVQHILTIMKEGELGEVTLGIKSYLENAQQGGSMEGEIAKKLRAAIESLQAYLITIPGSDSLVNAHRKKLIREMVKPFLNRKGISVKHEDFVIKENKAKSTLGKKAGKLTIVKAAASKLSGSKKTIKRQKQSKVKPPRMALKNILGLLNAKLPQQVADNMGSPRLENQTGTFAGSVRAIDVQETAQGI